MTKPLLKIATTLVLCFSVAGIALAAPVVRVVIKYVSNTNPQDLAHIKRIEAAMAAQGNEIDIQLLDVPNSAYADKLTLLLLSGYIPDLIYFQGRDQQMVDQDLLEDWRPLIAGTQYLKDALWPHNIARLENYPYLLYPYAARSKSALIRSDWLQKTGLGIPETLDDWTELLRIISNSDFDGDGINNTYGITAQGTTEDLDAVFNQAFGIKTSWIKNDGEWVDARVSEEERAKLTYYHMLFTEGLLDPEFITKNWEVKEDDFYAGKAGIIMGAAGLTVGIYHAKMRQVHPGTELIVLPPPAGIGRGLQATNVSKEPRGFALSVLSKNKELVVALMDFLAGPDGQMMDQMGFEGTHYTRDGDIITPTAALGAWQPRFFVVSPNLWRAPVDILAPVAQASLDQGMEFYSADNAFLYPPELAVDVDATENFYRTSVYRFLSGEHSLDEWDQYVANFNAVGGKKLTDYARTVLK